MSSHTHIINKRVIGAFLLFLVSLSLTSVLLLPSPVRAADPELGVIPTRLQVPVPGLTDDASGNIKITSSTLPNYIIKIYNFLLMAAVVLAVVMIVWGGFMWMTAGGGAERVTKAQEYIGNAIAGLIILFGAYLILSIVNPALTTLKPIKLQEIKPIAQGFFCDDRLGNLVSIYYGKKQVPPDIKFIPIQTRDESEAKDPTKQKTRVTDPNALQCGVAYALEQTTTLPGKPETKAIEPGACFGRFCRIDPRTGTPRTGYVCDPNLWGAGQPGCTPGAFAGNVYHEKKRGVTHVKVLQYDTAGYDDALLEHSQDSNSSGYVVPMYYMSINNAQLFYLQIELADGMVYYVGKGGKRIKLDDSGTCGIVTNAEPLEGQLDDCENLLWTGAEIKQGVEMDLDVRNNDIFMEGKGECVVRKSLWRAFMITVLPEIRFFTDVPCGEQ